MGLGRRTQLVIGDRLLDAFLDRAVQRVLQQGVLVHFLDQIGGNLTRTEAGHPHLRGDFLYLGINARFDIFRGNRHPICALQAFILCLDGLHVIFSIWDKRVACLKLLNGFRVQRQPRLYLISWCGRRDSNPHTLRCQNLNLVRLPIPPRPLTKSCRFTNDGSL